MCSGCFWWLVSMERRGGSFDRKEGVCRRGAKKAERFDGGERKFR